MLSCDGAHVQGAPRVARASALASRRVGRAVRLVFEASIQLCCKQLEPRCCDSKHVKVPQLQGTPQHHGLRARCPPSTDIACVIR